MIPENNYNEVDQGIDRITEILRRQSQPVASSPLRSEAMNLPVNLLNAIASSSYDYGNGGEDFVQNAQNFQIKRDNTEVNQQQKLLGAYEAKLKMGDARTRALDDKISLFTGGDPEGTALFLQELHNDPESIDPSNSYQVMTKLAGIKKRLGYVSPDQKVNDLRLKALGNKVNGPSAVEGDNEIADKRSELNSVYGKPQAGYEWTEDGTLEPIQGGSATKLSAEVAGRLGIAKSFIDEYQGIRTKLEDGVLTGSLDTIKQGLRKGDQGDVLRRIDTGVDGLRRMLTGAGMPASEAEEYVQRYRPEITDGKETQIRKLDGLAREITNAFETVGRGHMRTEEIEDIKKKTTPERKVLKTQVSPSTGKRKIIYSDGTEEIVDGSQ